MRSNDELSPEDPPTKATVPDGQQLTGFPLVGRRLDELTEDELIFFDNGNQAFLDAGEKAIVSEDSSTGLIELNPEWVQPEGEDTES